MSEYSGARLWRRINNVAVMLFIAIDNQSDVKGFKMEIAEVEEAAPAVCHGDRPRDGTKGQMPTGQTKSHSILIDTTFALINIWFFCKEECDCTIIVDWMI